ncbi:MAG: hypothetical protein R3B45_05890 [Bdellovibrionota bacterium]
MKIVFALFFFLSVLSCAHKRDTTAGAISSSRSDQPQILLNGSYLGMANYGHRKGINSPATRLYLQQDPDNQSSYYAVLLEYSAIQEMALQYLAANRFRELNEKYIGYLTKIATEISIFKAIPTNKNGEFSFYPIKIDSNNKISYDSSNMYGTLQLKEYPEKDNPLKGAKLTPNGWKRYNRPEEIVFPPIEAKKTSFPTRQTYPSSDNQESVSAQYLIAKNVYDSLNLQSTWYHEYINDTYLAAYNHKEDKVLVMSEEDGEMRSEFTLPSPKIKTDKHPRFTNPKSGKIQGKFIVKQPIPSVGIFTYEAMDSSADNYSRGEIESRIGLFIDIFNASESLNQAVVEFVMVNPNDPKDFLMYYEFPKE